MAAVDLIITAHNMEDCLGESLTSVCAQTFGNFRVIVVEDGSTDGTRHVANQAAAADKRIEVVHAPGLGAAGARNHGLDLVRAPLFMVLDGDDVFHSDMLEKLVGIIERCEADVAVCGMVQFYHDPNLPHHQRKWEAAPWALKKSQLPANAVQHCVNRRTIPGNLFAAFMGWPWDKLYRTTFVRNLDLRFPEDMPNSEDMLFTYKVLVLAERIAVIDEVLIDHRIGRGGSVSNSRAEHPLAFYDGICRLKSFLREQPDNVWNRLQKPFLNWAFDWTLWNIETLEDAEARDKLTRTLATGGFPALELAKHDPVYFTDYPRSMARYASLLEDHPDLDADAGPLGPISKLPYGEFKPWSQANLLERLAIKRRIRKNEPSEW